MMKILKLEKVVRPTYYIDTDAKEYSEFRTDGNGNWERGMGESWEQYYNCDELEQTFQEYIKDVLWLKS